MLQVRPERSLTSMITGAVLLETPGGGPPPYQPSAGTPVGPGPGPAGGMAGQRTSGKAITAMVLGIVGTCISWIFLLNIVAFLTGILAIIFGFLGKKEVDANPTLVTGKGMAITGIVLGILQLLLVIMFYLFLGAFLEEFDWQIEEDIVALFSW